MGWARLGRIWPGLAFVSWVGPRLGVPRRNASFVGPGLVGEGKGEKEGKKEEKKEKEEGERERERERGKGKREREREKNGGFGFLGFETRIYSVFEFLEEVAFSIVLRRNFNF